MMPLSATACPDLAISRLRERYANGSATPFEVMQQLLDWVEQSPHPSAWIHQLPREAVLARAQALTQQGFNAELPLYGIPFAIKDNIDVAGLPTTAACPAFTYMPTQTATVVQRLLDAGAVLIGKTNLDQFATGLVGTRTPQEAPTSVFNKEYVSGGSSSGSAVVVAAGYVSFSLGTDTAGSGRIPAAFNNVVGFKPTRGYLSTTGVLPACRSLDCVSVFALTAGDAWDVLAVAGVRDDTDPWSRQPEPQGLPKKLRIGVLKTAQREFFGDSAAALAYDEAITRVAELGDIFEFDFTPFREAAALLYDGPWVAERLEAAGLLLANQPDALDPAVRSVISKGLNYTAEDAYRAQTQLQALKKTTSQVWQSVDVLLMPTAPTHYRVADVQADPVSLNSHLGYYTNFANLLDLCAVAVPSGFKPDGLPFGVTFFAPAWHDAALAALGDRMHRLVRGVAGATGNPLAPPPPRFEWPVQANAVRLAVVGAHLSGMPLNHELTERAARLVRACYTASSYKLIALPGTVPPKPGMLRVAENGSAIAVEVWELSRQAFGDFVSRIPAPLGIGTLTLDDGEMVKGFVCESIALEGAEDISHFGGWRNYVAARNKP